MSDKMDLFREDRELGGPDDGTSLDPTLLELLEDSARTADCMYGSECPTLRSDGTSCAAHTRAARLRAAAARLRDEMDLAARRYMECARENNAPSATAWELVKRALRSVNAGPPPTSGDSGKE